MHQQEHSDNPHSGAHRALEAFGIFAASTLVVALAMRVTLSVWDAPVRALTVAGAAAVGVLLADLFSGVVHWGFDRFGDESMPFFGPAFVKPFRLHHTDPKDILRHGFLETNGNTSLATVIPLALLSFLPLESSWALFVVVAMTVASVLAVLTNQLHKWAHDESPPRAVAWMQRAHLILPRDHHALHHAWPHETHYCITTGWLNATLAKISLWRALERVIEMSGARVHRDGRFTS